MTTTRDRLSLFWVFLFLNFIFCDVFSLFYAPTLGEAMTGTIGGVEMSQPTLLGFAVLMELGMAMVLVARLAPHLWNRRANLAIGALLAVVQAGSLVTPGMTLHYAFFSAVEIVALIVIVRTAWMWRRDD